MLKNIPPLLSPDLVHVLMRMGHGDEIVLADANFPAEANARRLIRADGLAAPALLNAVLQLLPIDTFVKQQALVMQPVDTAAPEPPIWSEYQRLLREHEGRAVQLTPLERFEFYRRSREAFAIVATGEAAHYANLILVKGVLR